MAQKLVPAKEKKLSKLFEKHGMGITEKEFISIFPDEYPKDWMRIIEGYEMQEERRKPRQKAPMPKPEIYLSNMYKVYMKKHSKK